MRAENGRIIATSRAQWFANLASYKFDQFEARVVDVAVDGDTAVATVEGHWKVGMPGRGPREENFILSDTFVKRGGAWQVLFRHSTPSPRASTASPSAAAKGAFRRLLPRHVEELDRLHPRPALYRPLLAKPQPPVGLRLEEGADPRQAVAGVALVGVDDAACPMAEAELGAARSGPRVIVIGEAPLRPRIAKHALNSFDPSDVSVDAHTTNARLPYQAQVSR